MNDFIYHITSRAAWLAAKETGRYRAESLDQVGFIHCSKAAQILRVAESYYTSRHGMVILVIDPSRLEAELRWEPGTDKTDELFPHIYGPLEVEAVMCVYEFEPGADGHFSLPGDLE